MTNQERAERIILGRLAPDAAQELHKAGLLMTDLPEPDLCTGSMIIWDHVCHSVTWNKFLGVSLIAEVNERSLPIDEARNIAYALLAAANYAEEQK